MRVRFFGLAAAVAAVTVSLGAAAAFAATPTVLVDGQKLQSDVPAIEVNGRVLVPLRGIMERLGASVNYDAKTQVIVIALNDREISLRVGSTLASVNAKPVILDVAARTFAGRSEVPLRFIGESLGASVDYDAPSDTAVIVTGRSQGNFVAALSGPRLASVYRSRQYAPASVQDERPTPESVVGSAYPEIYARFAGGSAAVNPGSITVRLDGSDITAAATVSAAYVSYTPARQLYNGTHTVEISGRTDDGTPFDEQWNFRIDAGTNSSYVSSIIDDGYGPFGYPRYGFYPPGFSLFVPGPQFFVAGNIIEIILYSPFYPYGSCFISITGFPGSYTCSAWGGFPGYFYAWVPVPYGVFVTNGTVIGHFRSFNGPRVIVHATAPITINGQRTTLPEHMRFVNLPVAIRHPQTPDQLVIVHHQTLPNDQFRPVNPGLPVFVHLPSGGHPVSGGDSGRSNGGNAPVIIHAPATAPPSAGNKPLPEEKHPLPTATARPIPDNATGNGNSNGGGGNSGNGNPGSGGNPKPSPRP